MKNWKLKILGLLLCAAAVFNLKPPNAQAAGLLIADGGFGGVLEIQEHDVHVTINNGIAVTKITEVFKNTESRQVEALYTFPVPKGASVANFSMWIHGKEMVGEVLEKKRARQIYESYKVTRQDPGLLEQADFRTFEMRIFPIEPGAEQKVEITYYQELEVDHDWATYVFPLATSTRQTVDSRTTGKFALTLEARSAVPISVMESPSHGADFIIAKHSDSYYQASLETQGGSLAEDIVIAFRLSRPQTGLDLITSKRHREDGYFCLTLTPGEELAQAEAGMDYVFLLDISGSMAADGKLLLSKDSIGAFINELGDHDRFEVMTFNVQPNMAFETLQPATAEFKTAALQYLAAKRAAGGTILNPAVTTAYKYADPDRPLNVVILSDGLTEQRERRVLLELIQSRPRNARVFCIGVGNDVNRPLLEQLASDSGGLAAFISRGDNFSRQAGAFRRKLTRPIATDLQLDFGGLKVTDVVPGTLPNLYHGAPVRIYGRYQGGGEATITLRASVNGAELKQAVKMQFPREDPDNPEIERMWAWHKIDGLLKGSERAGARDKVIDEVVRLGEGYSIVTEYTSFLVLENDAEYQRWKIARTNAARHQRDRKAQELVRNQLELIRSKAVADLGPQPARNIATDAPSPVRNIPVTRQVTASPTSQSQESPSADSGRSRGSNVGSAPVGPLFLGLLWLFARLKRRAD
jgi:Ca-activated chloride channel homolog